ncbi:MAG TPA: hypothetical protein DIT99_32740, partial [Candidatus Latescibacteria bacterium]|nr:hypothetical protein [Candidatus Latescibacterota bacterium]
MPVGTSPRCLLECDPDKIDGGVSSVAGFVPLANIDGVIPADRAGFRKIGRRELLATAALRPHATLEVDVDLVACMGVDALPLA